MYLCSTLHSFIILVILRSPISEALPINNNSSRNATERVKLLLLNESNEGRENKTVAVVEKIHHHFNLNDIELHRLLKLPSRGIDSQNDTVIVVSNSQVKGYFLQNISHAVTAEELQFLSDTIFEMNNTKGGFTCPLLRCKRCPFGYVEDASSCPVCVCKERRDCPDLSKCKKKCFLSSFMKDGNGCTLCKCKRLRACPVLYCGGLSCFYGYEEDELGCQICKCKQQSNLCPSTSNCKKRCYFGHEVDSNFCKTCRCKRQKRCPGNLVAVTCHQDPCERAKCRGRPDAICQVDYCNGCFPRFYEKNKMVKCL